MVSLNIFVTTIILLKCLNSEALVNDIKLPAMQSKIDNVAECIKKLFKKEVPSESVVFIVSSNNSHKSLLQSINMYYHFSVITRSFDEQRWLVYPDAYLILVKSNFDFLTGITKLAKDLSWNPSAKFIIIHRNLRDDRREILEVFNVLLQKNIIDVLLIKLSKNDLELLTYYPYSGNSCGRNASDIRSFGYCRNLTDSPLFPDKTPNGLRNCTLQVAARDCAPYVIADTNGNYSKYLDTGIEQYVFNIIAKYEGFKYETLYIDPKEGFGVVLPNKTVTGLLGYLQNDNISVILGGLFLLNNRIEMFDFIFGYNYALFSIFTPIIQEEKWTRAYRQFGYKSWSLIIISFAFATTIILITLRITSGKPKDEFMIILKLWRYFYGQVDHNLFSHKYLRRIMIVWIVYTNSICAFYNTALYSLITGHVKNQIHIDPSDIASLPLTPCISDQVRTFFKLSYNEIFPEGDGSPQCQNADTAFEGVATRTDLYTIDTNYAYFLRGAKYEDAEGNPKIKKWDFPRNLVFSIYMKKGFPLQHNFQKCAFAIHESGLLQRHLTNLLDKKQKALSVLKKQYSPILVEDFIIHFSILIIGTVVSLISFVIELRVGKNKCRITL